MEMWHWQTKLNLTQHKWQMSSWCKTRSFSQECANCSSLWNSHQRRLERIARLLWMVTKILKRRLLRCQLLKMSMGVGSRTKATLWALGMLRVAVGHQSRRLESETRISHQQSNSEEAQSTQLIFLSVGRVWVQSLRAVYRNLYQWRGGCPLIIS